MVISCERIAMAGKEDPELRVTFDRNIRWRDYDLDLTAGAEGRPVLEEGQVLMEVKIRDALSCEFARLFSELGIFPCSFSKYGRAYEQRLSEERTQRVHPFEVRGAAAETGKHASVPRHGLASA